MKLALVGCVSEPLVPLIGSEKVPGVVDEQDTVAVPDPETLPKDVGLQVSPDGTVSVSWTVPAKPLRAVTVIVEIALWPVFTAVGEDATMLKS